MNSKEQKIHWPNFLFLTLSPLVALAGTLIYAHFYGVRAWEMVLFAFMFFATGLSITAGYHRHFAHVSYKAHPCLKLFYLIFGACALENSALSWASDHRLHHKYTDTEQDPYNAGKGFWSSHIGWIFYQSTKAQDLTNVGDLKRDALTRWQHRHHWKIAMLVGFVGPTLIGFMVGRPFGGFLWGGLVRVVVVQHMTFFINSLAHMVGTQPYSRTDTSRDSWWLAFLTNGEGYHNFHHRFPSDYRNGIRWFQWDPTKWLIWTMQLTQMTDKLHRVPSHLILRARMEVEALEAERHLERVPEHLVLTVRQRVETARVRLEHALAQWAETKARIRELKAAAWKDSEGTRKQWKLKLQEYETRLEEARDHWRTLLQGLQRLPVSTI
jgi:stearoyl-CoA desaturase (delta-9 desaturase)